MQEMQVQSLGGEDPLEEEMATHSSIVAWRIPWAEEPGGLQSIGLQRVRHNWATKPPPAAYPHILTRWHNHVPHAQQWRCSKKWMSPSLHRTSHGRPNYNLSPLAFLLEKEMATHSSVLAWRIPGMGKPGGLPSVGSHRVGHDWSNLAAVAAAFLQTSFFFLTHLYSYQSSLTML